MFNFLMDTIVLSFSLLLVYVLNHLLVVLPIVIVFCYYPQIVTCYGSNYSVSSSVSDEG